MMLQSKNGYPEVVLSSKCGSEVFYTTADWLRHEMGISYCNKENADNKIFWQFHFGTGIAVLKYDPSCGVSLCPAHLGKATLEDEATFKMVKETIIDLQLHLYGNTYKK